MLNNIFINYKKKLSIIYKQVYSRAIYEFLIETDRESLIESAR